MSPGRTLGEVYYLLYTTERCNLRCAYCDPKDRRDIRTQAAAYPFEALVAFLRQDPAPHLQFYGGEPLLEVDFIERVLAAVEPRRVVIQTNGLLLERLSDAALPKIDVVTISLDGPQALTDGNRGAGVYDKALAQARALRERGFAGDIDARLTISPGDDVFAAVSHFIDECAFPFDSIHWQLNVLFDFAPWWRDRHDIAHWFKRAYNPGITRLVELWTERLVGHGELIKLVPFATTMRSLLDGTRVAFVQCGAGAVMWTIATDGSIYPCPVMRDAGRHRAGHILGTRPTELSPLPPPSPCDRCEVYGLCGGRCIEASASMRWGTAGFDLVCQSVKHLLRELQRVRPRIEEHLRRGGQGFDDYFVGFDYEVIP